MSSAGQIGVCHLAWHPKRRKGGGFVSQPQGKRGKRKRKAATPAERGIQKGRRQPSPLVVGRKKKKRGAGVRFSLRPAAAEPRTGREKKKGRNIPVPGKKEKREVPRRGSPDKTARPSEPVKGEKGKKKKKRGDRPPYKKGKGKENARPQVKCADHSRD